MFWGYNSPTQHAEAAAIKAAQKHGSVRGCRVTVIRAVLDCSEGANIGRGHAFPVCAEVPPHTWRNSRPCSKCMRLLQLVGCARVVYTAGHDVVEEIRF